MFRVIATIGYSVLKVTVMLSGPLVFLALIFKQKFEEVTDKLFRRYPYQALAILMLWLILCCSAGIGVLFLEMQF